MEEISALAAIATINPIWTLGPYRPDQVSTNAQPDWYMGFAEGLIRVMPGWEVNLWGHTLVLGVFIPLMVFPLVLLVIAVYPFVEAWVTGDRGEHHVADRPRNAPTRTAFGVAWLTCYLILLLAGGNDLWATHLHLSVNAITWCVRVGFFVAPVVAFLVTKRVCLGLQRRDREKVLHGRETGVIKRLPHGEFVEVHEPLSPARRYTLTAHEQYAPLDAPAHGEDRAAPDGSLLASTRVALSQAMYGERGQIPKPAGDDLHEIESGAEER
ncbi:Cytochrome bc1 complex cytochrome b subunit OS=Streptomyces tendae OX=1932 GN=GUR47_11730 PE=4 SV=1 [Streptomyces tendae]